MAMARRILFLVFAVWLSSGLALAQTVAPHDGKRVALVIGNGGYRNVAPLINPPNDAKLMADTVRSLGFTLVGGGALLNLDRDHLSAAVHDFGNELIGAEVGLFYYAGHGLQVNGVNWLVPVDANVASERDLDFQMVDASLVLRQMEGVGTKLNIVLLDACRNNPFAVSGLRAIRTGLAEMHAPRGTLISYATQPGNVALDGTGANSPYAEALSASLRTPGLDIFRLFNQVGLRVERGTDGRQQPWVSTSPIEGDFYFSGAPVAPVATPVPPPPVVTASVALPAPVLPPTVLPPTVLPTPVLSPPVLPPPAAPPPAPTAPVPAAAVVPLPVPAPDPDDAAVREARNQPCSILDIRKAGSEFRLLGLARGGEPWDDLMRRMQSVRSLRIGRPAVEMLPAFACDVVDVLGPEVRDTRFSANRQLIVPPRVGVVTGGTLTITLHQAAPEQIQLDVFQAGGTVQHLSPRLMDRTGDDARYAVALPKLGAGQYVLAAMAADTPFAPGARPAAEPTAPYLVALRAAISGRSVRADLMVFEVPPTARPPAVPVAAASPARPPRCSAILERAQLGEPVSDSDRAFLRGACH
jgi:hypothetical protein